MFQERTRPGEVPEIAEGLPDETVAEELLVVVDEPVVGGHGGVVVLVAGVDGAYLAHQVLHSPRSHQLGLLALYLGVENGGEEIVGIGRQMAGVLVDACVVGAEGQDLAVLRLVPVDDVGHLEHAGWEGSVHQGHDIPVGRNGQESDYAHHCTGPLGEPLREARGEQGEEGEEGEEIVELNGQGGIREHQQAVSAEDEPLHLLADSQEEDGYHQHCPNAELDELEPPEGRLAVSPHTVIVEDVDLEISIPERTQGAMNGEVDQHTSRNRQEAEECPPDDGPELLRLAPSPSDEEEHEQTSGIEEQEVELHPEEQRHAEAHREGMPPGRDLPVHHETEHVVEAMGKDGQGELLHTVAIREEVGRIGQHTQQAHQGNGYGRGGEEPHRSERIEQIEVAAHDLEQVDAHETAPGKHGRPFVQEEEHGPLVVEDVHIEFLAAQHGVAYGHIDIRVVPRIERIEQRASAQQGDEDHRKEEQERLSHQFIFHNSQFIVAAKILNYS